MNSYLSQQFLDEDYKSFCPRENGSHLFFKEVGKHTVYGHAEKVIHGKNGYCGIYVPIKRYQNGSFQTVWYLASFFNSNISVVKGDTVFLRGYRISDKSYNGFDYLDLTCSDIIGIHNL